MRYSSTAVFLQKVGRRSRNVRERGNGSYVCTYVVALGSSDGVCVRAVLFFGCVK